MKLRANAIAKQIPGNSVAVRAIVLIHCLPVEEFQEHQYHIYEI